MFKKLNLDILKKHITTIFYMFNMLYFILFWFDSSSFNKHILIFMMGLTFPLVCNRKFNNSWWKVLIASTIAAVSSNYLLKKDMFNVIYYKKFVILFSLILLIYLIQELKENRINITRFISKTLVYIGYAILSSILALLFIFTINIIINFQYYIDRLAISIILIIFTTFFILYQEDERKYENVFINRILSVFVIAMMTIPYLSLIINGFNAISYIVHTTLWIGYAVLIFNIRINKKFIPLIMLTVNGYLIYIILEQMNNYGITENRYFVLVMGILLFILYLAQVIKSIEEYVYISVITLFLTLIFFMPGINAFAIARNSLTDRARILVEKYDKLTEYEYQDLYSYQFYFNARNYDTEFIQKKLDEEKIFEGVKEFIDNIEYYSKGILTFDISKYTSMKLYELYEDDTDIIIDNQKINIFELFLEHKEEVQKGVLEYKGYTFLIKNAVIEMYENKKYFGNVEFILLGKEK